MASSPKKLLLVFHPLTPDRWEDFARLFGKRGACGGCWCMWWRLKRSEFEIRKGSANRRAMRRIVKSGDRLVCAVAQGVLPCALPITNSQAH